MPDTTTNVPAEGDFPAKPRRQRTRHLGRLESNAIALYIDDADDPVLLQLTSDTTLGRHSPNIISQPQIDLTPYSGHAKGVSRMHAVIHRTASGRLTVEDLLSSNGTALNGVRLAPYMPHPLESGDYLRLGRLGIEVYFDAVPNDTSDGQPSPERLASGANAEQLLGERSLLLASRSEPAIYEYQAVASIDPVQVMSEMARLADEVIQQLTSLNGCDVKLTVEIRARSAQQFAEATVQAITESGKRLKLNRSHFTSLSS